MPLVGMWPIQNSWPVSDGSDLSPIELEKGISLVMINKKDEAQSSGKEEFTLLLTGKGEIKAEMYLSDRGHPLSRLPRMGLLFEIQDKKREQLFMPHHYVIASMRPRTILRLFKMGEFIPSLVLYEHGYYIHVPVSSNPELLHYEITSNDVRPLKDFYSNLLKYWKGADLLLADKRKSKKFENIYWRLNNSVQLLDKTYCDEFGFARTIRTNEDDTSRADNYLRLLFCWMGIESLACHDENKKQQQLKKHLPVFLSGIEKDKIVDFIDSSYSLRSAYIHADPVKMHRIINRDLNIARDVLKMLILIYLLIASDEDVYKELDKHASTDPLKGLASMDLNKYFEKMKAIGANFDSYSFKM